MNTMERLRHEYQVARLQPISQHYARGSDVQVDPPYISVVVAARNDDHGGNMLGRMRCMLDSWIKQAEALGLSSEIIIVEWNPPAEHPRLRESLSWPATPSKHCEIRIFEVPWEIHAGLGNASAIPLHQMIAKNVGIRRAHGRFVLATNLDIIFSADLMKFLAERRLEQGVMYRMDRHDVARDAPSCKTLEQLLDYCRSHTKRIFAREGDFSMSEDGVRLLDQPDIVDQGAGIRFGRGWSQVENSGPDRYRWMEALVELVFDKTVTDGATIVFDAEVGPSAGSAPVVIEVIDEQGARMAVGSMTGRCQVRLQIPADTVAHRIVLQIRGADLPIARHLRIANLRTSALHLEPPSTQIPAFVNKWRLEISPNGPAFPWHTSFYATSPFASEIRNAAYLHTNACGDFTLIARDDWFSLRGYPELPIWPMHIDALLCYSANHAGVRESILSEPMRIFHVEHTTGAGWTPEGEKARLARIASKGVTELSYPTFVAWVDLMRRYDAPAIFTRDNWGLSDVSLTEHNP